MALSTMGFIVTLGVNVTQHYATQHLVPLCWKSLCYVIMLSVVTLRAIMPIILCCVFMLSVILRGVIMVSVEAQAILFKHFSF